MIQAIIIMLYAFSESFVSYGLFLITIAYLKSQWGIHSNLFVGCWFLLWFGLFSRRLEWFVRYRILMILYLIEGSFWAEIAWAEHWTFVNQALMGIVLLFTTTDFNFLLINWFMYWDRFILCSPGWPRTHCIYSWTHRQAHHSQVV